MTAKKETKVDIICRGRPSLYRPEYADQLIYYFENRNYEAVAIRNARTGAEEIIYEPPRFPTVARFATLIGVSRDTLYEWATGKDDEGNVKHPEFSDAYKRAQDYIEAALIEGAIVGKLNAPFSIFAAKNILGWTDGKSENDNQLTITVVNGIED